MKRENSGWHSDFGASGRRSSTASNRYQEIDLTSGATLRDIVAQAIGSAQLEAQAGPSSYGNDGGFMEVASKRKSNRKKQGSKNKFTFPTLGEKEKDRDSDQDMQT